MKIKKRVKFLTGLIALFVVTTVFFAQREIRYIKMKSAHEVWQQAREADLVKKETGWLNLAGLFWLEEGRWSMGSGSQNDFVLREGNAPDQLGVFVRHGDDITFQAAENVPVKIEGMDGVQHVPLDALLLKDDEEEMPTVLSLERLQWWVISRDGMLGVRVRDLESLHLANFAGIESFEFDSDWRVEAQFLPFESPREYEYPTILGTVRQEEAPGVLVFNLDGRQFEMVPFERKEGTQFFLVFGDQTNGESTYEGGRFLYADMPDETGKTTIDFNRAYNPPCAFSAYSTCPQPLRQNRLSVRVNAGEVVYVKPETKDSVN